MIRFIDLKVSENGATSTFVTYTNKVGHRPCLHLNLPFIKTEVLAIKKLDLMGFTNVCLKRTQELIVNNAISKKVNVLSCVPQGSQLVPILFLLFINDLPSVTKYCNVLLYADYVKIFLTYNNSRAHLFLQKDLYSFFAHGVL